MCMDVFVYVGGGHHERTDTGLFLTEEGMVRGAGITRVLEEDRYDNQLLACCQVFLGLQGQ